VGEESDARRELRSASDTSRTGGDKHFGGDLGGLARYKLGGGVRESVSEDMLKGRWVLGKV